MKTLFPNLTRLQSLISVCAISYSFLEGMFSQFRLDSNFNSSRMDPEMKEACSKLRLSNNTYCVLDCEKTVRIVSEILCLIPLDVSNCSLPAYLGLFRIPRHIFESS